MKNKAVGKCLFIIMFIVLLCLPEPFWAVAGKEMAEVNYENRKMTEKPVFKSGELGNYLTAYENYINDTLPFRDSLIQLNSRIDYYGFRTSSNDDVIIGKDGWLFYNCEDDGEPISDYLGENLFTEEQLEDIRERLTKAERHLAESNAEFILMIVPNKERVFSEMMPDYYGEPAEQYRTRQLIEYLRKTTDIRIVYPYDDLMQAKKELPDVILYHKTDTHWNHAGAYVGAAALLRELRIEIPSLADDSIQITEVMNEVSDLAGMLHMASDLGGKEKDYVISGYDTHAMAPEKLDPLTEFIYHNESADPRKLFIYRDSFCSDMADILASQFDESYMIHKDIYTNSALEAQQPDIFVLETVERYLVELLEFDIERSTMIRIQ